VVPAWLRIRGGGKPDALDADPSLSSPRRAEAVSKIDKMAAPRDFVDYVQSRGYTATPITNCIAAVQDGVKLTVVAYEMRGPRRGRAIVEKSPDGLLSLDRAALHCDGWDYATRKMIEKRERK
jgi:hypothetical protein